MIRPIAARFRRWFLGDKLWQFSRSTAPGRALADPVVVHIKNAGRQLAKSLTPGLDRIDLSLEPRMHGLTSKPSTQRDVESPWFVYWCRQLGVAPDYHRKRWEHAFLLQVLHERGLTRPGAAGLGFGCGEEPIGSYLVSQGVATTLTDLHPAAAAGKGWMETGQHASHLDHAFKADLVAREDFDRLARFEYVDMNAIPSSLDGQYDFCWSICALEHLGSIENGLRFVENAMRTLRPGGVAIHTTEFNFLSESETVESGPTVLFLARHFRELKERLERSGHRVGTLDLDAGDGVVDGHVDVPPYEWDLKEGPAWVKETVHLKLALDGFPSTCFGIVVERG